MNTNTDPITNDTAHQQAAVEPPANGCDDVSRRTSPPGPFGGGGEVVGSSDHSSECPERVAGAGGVLFLDIDGVLNSEAWYHARESRKRPNDEIDPAAVARLQRVILETGCSVVISSTWRRMLTVGALVRVLVNRGLSMECWEKFIGATPVLDSRTDSGIYTAVQRGHEIQAFLDRWPEKFERVVIVDDDGDMAHLRPLLVQTDFADGMTDEVTSAIIARLVGRAAAAGCGDVPSWHLEPPAPNEAGCGAHGAKGPGRPHESLAGRRAVTETPKL